MACVDAATAKASTTAKGLITLSSSQRASGPLSARSGFISIRHAVYFFKARGDVSGKLNIVRIEKPSLAEGFLGSEILFQFADASLLPLVAQNLGGDKSQPASLMTSGLIAVPQLVVVLLAPWVGYLSASMGRKPLLLIGFAVEVARAVLLGLISNYSLLLLALAGTEFGLSRETDGPACWNFAGLNSLGISSVVRIAERPRFGVYFRCSVICVFSVFGNSRAVRLLVGDCG
jgi:MFS family permease